jgi:hypothetical protein
MKRNGLVRLVAATAIGVGLSGLLAIAQGNGRFYSTALSGGDEVPSVSTAARGSLILDIDEAAQQIRYELSYQNLSSPVAQAHIHFAQPGVNGGIFIWLCQATSAPAPGLGINPPPCPQSGSVGGVIGTNDVIATAATQQLGAGEFQEAVAAIRAGLAYANVHTATSPGGEIRGQLKIGLGQR